MLSTFNKKWEKKIVKKLKKLLKLCNREKFEENRPKIT